MKSEEEIREGLLKELSTRGAQKRIAQTLEVSATTVMRWGGGETIPPAMQKLLSLYLFGEIPFSMLRDPNDAQTLLEFTEEEWRLITILSARAGQEPPAWIRSQIIAYLAFSQSGGEQSTGYGKESNPLRPLARVAEEGNEYLPASDVKRGPNSPPYNDEGAA